MTEQQFQTTVRAGDREITVPTGLFLGGKFTSGSESETFAVVDASTGQEFASVASATTSDANTAMDNAAAAQKTWGETSPMERSELLYKIFELIKENTDDLALLQSLELGRALKDSVGEVAYSAEFFRWFSSRPWPSPAITAWRPRGIAEW